MDRTEVMARDAYYADQENETATVLWLGYDAPDSVFPEATEPEWAEGAANFSEA